MRIAFIGPLEVPGSGGVKLHCEELGARLVERGHDVTIYVASGRRRRSYRGMTIRRCGRLPLRNLDRLFYGLMASLHATFGRHDIVHYHGFASTTFCGLPRLRHRPVAVTAHRLEWRDAKWGRLAGSLLRHNERAAVKRAGIVIAVSRSLADDLSCRYPKLTEVHYVPNGVALPTPTGAVARATLHRHGLESGRYVLVVGRLQPEKGVETVLGAWELLVAEHEASDWRLAIVGDARHRTAYVRRLSVQAACIGSSVALTGALDRSALSALYRGAGIVVSASHHEGQPLAVMEAMAAGCALVLSDIPAHRELCGDAAHYFPVDDAAELAPTLRELLARADCRHQLGERAAHVATAHGGFSWDRTAGCTEALLRRL